MLVQFQEHKRLERDYGKMKRKLEQANKEKDSSKAECSKVNAQKQKMETLCRELQKENKRITEEHRRLSAFEQRKRDELSTKFESTIWEIKSKMEEDSDERRRRTEDNEMLKDKFKDFLEQYELREKHYNQMVKSREIEIQLLEAKLEQQRRVNGDENIKIAAMKGQVSSFVKTETDLRKQLSIYVEKFKQVEETLNKSNELFITFRKEMEQMTKKTRKLEKENASVRLKCERMNKNIIEMAAERTKTYKSVETAHAGKLKLENLCRALQTERNALRKRLEQLESRTPSPHKEPPPAPPPPLDQSTQHDGGGTDTSGKPDANRRRENDGTTSNDEFLEVHADDSVDQDAGDPA
ncbi:myosin-like coiled-coil protein-domain-containing protein [Powellomyces hirtus]|nr:myosin-like coiled-coil protein-domain-containing protein [Powellomyces hirtus]